MYVALRFVSLLLVAVGLALLGADLISTLEHGGNVTIRSLDHVWNAISPETLSSCKSWVHEKLPPWLSETTYSFMALPGWAVFGVPGVVLAFAFTGRRTEA